MPIINLAKQMEISSLDDLNIESTAPESPDPDCGTRKLPGNICGFHGDLAGQQISSKTHGPESPWDETRKNHPRIKNANIDNETIKVYCKRLSNGD